MKLWRFMQREKGTISIFMAVIMLSMIVLTSVFVDGSRIRSAEAIVQSASDSAIRSVTAKYDKELKERYGLFTLEESEQEKIKQDYLKFFTANVSASLPGAEDSFHRYLDQIMQMVSGETDQYALDLFDFQVAEASVDPVYSIVEPDVLQKQMVEFAKYRSAFVVADLFDIGKDIRDSMEKSQVDAQNMKKTLASRQDVEEVMKDTYKWADDLQEHKDFFDNHRTQWREDIVLMRNRMGDLEDVMEEIAETYAEIAEEEAKEDGDTSALLERLEELKEEAAEIYSPSKVSIEHYRDKKIAPLIESLEEMKEKLEGEKKKVQPFLQRITEAKATVEQSKNSLSDKGTEEVTENLKKDADEMKQELDKLRNIVQADEKWLKETITRLDNALKKLNALSKKITVDLSEADSESEARRNVSTLVSLQKDAGTAADCFKNKTGDVEQYKFENTWGPLAESVKNLYVALTGDSKLKTTNEIKDPAVISDAQRESLPSVLYQKDNTYHTNEKYAEMDKKYTELQESSGIASGDKEIDLEGVNAKNAEKSLNIIESFLGFMGDMAVDATNAVVTDLYTMSMFKARTTKTTDYWKDVYDNSIVDVEKQPYDRGRSTEEDKNLRLIEKALYSKENGNNFMDAELEYIIVGDMNEKDNANSVYARIFGIRMGINTIAVLADSDLNSLSTAAASLSGPFAPVVKVAILLVLALVETYLDMYFLLDKGYKVALLKTKGLLTLSKENLENILENIDFDNMEGVELFSIFQPSYRRGAIMIDYETYIYFLLLLVERETKLLRMADLMQLNMQLEQKDPDYCMAEHYTAVRAEMEATIKPMMMGLPFVPSDMRQDGRYSVRTMIYEGY